jgi:hypothetical protein
MAQDLPSPSEDLLAKLLPIFEKIDAKSLRLKDSLEALEGIYQVTPFHDIRDSTLDESSSRVRFQLLATCLNEARILKSVHLWEAFSIFADASREREWKSVGAWLWLRLMLCSKVERIFRQTRVALNTSWMAN